jgi:hypothetical protein
MPLSSLCFSQEPVLPENPFNQLPNELVLEIMGYMVEDGDINACLQVDRRFQECMLKDLDQYDLDLPVDTDHRTRRKDRSGELLRMGLARLTDDYKPLSVLLTGQGVEKIIRLQGLRESSQLELYAPDPPRMLSDDLKKVLKQDDYPVITKMTISYDEPGFIFWIRQAASTISELTIQCGHKLFMQPHRRKELLNTFFSTSFPRLKTLTLYSANMTGIDLFNFVRHSGNFPVLKNLDLSSNHLNSVWFNAFVQSSLLKKLKKLDLSNNKISSRYLAYLIRHGDLRNLKYLSLKDTGTTAKQILNPNGHGGRSIRIDLYNMSQKYWNWRYHHPVQQDYDIRGALQSARYLGTLRELDLFGTNVYEGRTQEIMAYASLPALQVLHLGREPTIRQPAATISG